MVIDRKRMILSGAAVAGVALAYIAVRGPATVGKQAGKALVGVAEGTITGIVTGVGGVVGLPDTTTEAGRRGCCATIREYDPAWSAWAKIKHAFRVSTNCPAGDYLRWASGGGRPDYCT